MKVSKQFMEDGIDGAEKIHFFLSGNIGQETALAFDSFVHGVTYSIIINVG